MKKHLLVALSVLCLCSCFEEKKVVEKPKEDIVAKQETKPAPEKNDKYVYIDEYNCLHTKKDCLWHINQENWERPTHAIKFVLKCELKPNDVQFYCRECVDVEHFEEIKDIARVNRNRLELNNFQSEEEKKAYESFEDFVQMLYNSFMKKAICESLNMTSKEFEQSFYYKDEYSHD